MGISIDGEICFGIVFEEGYEFPWECDKYEGDIDECIYIKSVDIKIQ